MHWVWWPFVDHIRAVYAFYRHLNSPIRVTRCDIGGIHVDHFQFSSNDLFLCGMNRRRAFAFNRLIRYIYISIANYGIVLATRHQRQQRKGHLIEAIFMYLWCVRALLIMIFDGPKTCVPKRHRTKHSQLQFMSSPTGLQWRWHGLCWPGPYNGHKYVIYLLRNIYGFHTIYNHIFAFGGRGAGAGGAASASVAQH